MILKSGWETKLINIKVVKFYLSFSMPLKEYNLDLYFKNYDLNIEVYSFVSPIQFGIVTTELWFIKFPN